MLFEFLFCHGYLVKIATIDLFEIFPFFFGPHVESCHGVCIGPRQWFKPRGPHHPKSAPGCDSSEINEESSSTVQCYIQNNDHFLSDLQLIKYHGSLEKRGSAMEGNKR